MRRIIASILALAALMGPLAVGTSSARADGDPASDVLAFQRVFVPPDAGASPKQIAELTSAVNAASRGGFPLRVALIGSAADLGTVTQDWGNPSGYARYLGAELSLLYRGPTLVAMPQGYALWVNGSATRGENQVLGNLTAPGSDLAAGALGIVARLAAADGVRLPSRLGSSLHGTSAHRTASGSPLALIGFIVGLAAVAIAWGLSLRARPLRARVAA